jgi:hypothetical protein
MIASFFIVERSLVISIDLGCQQTLKHPPSPADIIPMGEVVKLPNCREIFPEVFRLIKRRTRNPSYGVRYWSTYWSRVNSLICEMDPGEVDERILDYIWIYVVSYFHDRNRAAIKARGF